MTGHENIIRKWTHKLEQAINSIQRSERRCETRFTNRRSASCHQRKERKNTRKEIAETNKSLGTPTWNGGWSVMCFYWLSLKLKESTVRS
ncbi:hypothetical protein M513_14103 [Trichuris suis]|uniref:Uncharacterized protein n=1 Tax=Trichuris suis TaxID=68888 RepID=A0A085LJ74_9BILA|nr:hypothetical protein M513_14103 [Trichuris suis]